MRAHGRHGSQEEIYFSELDSIERVLLQPAVGMVRLRILAIASISWAFRPAAFFRGSVKGRAATSTRSSGWDGQLGLNGGSWGGHSTRNEFLETNELSTRAPLFTASTDDENLLENVESPLKTMVFIDGTQRASIISRLFGNTLMFHIFMVVCAFMVPMAA
jgi:hypothetical protein